MTADAITWADSRDIAESFGHRHHNVLRAIDLVMQTCPAAAGHVWFGKHGAVAGLGGTRYVRHAYVDRIGFMLLAMAFASTQRELAMKWLMRFNEPVGLIPATGVQESPSSGSVPLHPSTPSPH